MGGPDADFSNFRSLFPALERCVWLNTPTAPPAARPVLDAIRRAEREWEEGTFSWQTWEAEAHATRKQVADLVGAAETSIALVSSVAEAAATVALSLPAGRVVVGEREFRSNLFPWLSLKSRGFDVVEVPSRDGVVTTEALLGAIDGSTVLVAVSEVQSSNGFRIRLADIAERSREVGARVFVNLTQLLGALSFKVMAERVDFFAIHGYKWLLGPRGAAWLYVRPDRLREMTPVAPNWKSVARPYDEYYGGPLDFATDARKLDTSLAWFAWVGARAALDLILTLDARAVELRCLALAAAFRQQAGAAGFRIVDEEAPSHIVALAVPDPDGLRDRLAERRVIGAVRGGYLRLGFHAFNNEDDLEAAFAALGRPG